MSLKRTLAQVSQEYSNLCAKAGNIQYQIQVFGEDLKLVNEQLKDLNFEATKLKSETKTEEKSE